MATWVAASSLLRRARGAGSPQGELAARRRVHGAFAVEHLALVVLLATGFALLHLRGGVPGHARWLSLKVGIVLFLVIPLEAMHAYVCHVWIARGLRQTSEPPFAKDLTRGIGMEEMIRTLGWVLLGAGVPLLVWLSLAKPF